MAHRRLLVNRKGQFSIIAAILVAIILISAVMATYSAIQYKDLQNDPQTQSTIDEVNLSLKKVLGFTVGYYGSVLQVTGNTSYAKILATNYMKSGLENTADLKANLGASFNATTLDLATSWFSNTSFSSGSAAIKYDLADLGVYGLTYAASSRLDVRILQSPNPSQACVSVLKDMSEPLINLGISNFKFYKYAYSNSTWVYSYLETSPISFTNGTYLLNIPSDIDPTAYILSVEDSRGIMVVASSFSRYTSTLTWNSTSVETNFHYVNSSNPVTGSSSNFTAQQYGPDYIFDSLSEQLIGTFTRNYNIETTKALTGRYSYGGVTDTFLSDNHYLAYHPARSGSTVVLELNGTLNDEPYLDNWQSLTWWTELAVSWGDANCIIQFWNYASESYATSGEGYATTTLNDHNKNISQTITNNPSYYRDSNGNWKLKITVTGLDSSYTDLEIDWIRFSPSINNYALDMREQFIGINATNPRQDLCIKTGSFDPTENLLVDVWYNSAWVNIMTLSANSWNNASLSSYINSPNLTIRFRDANNATDWIPSSWNIDVVFLKNQPDISLIIGLQQSTFTLEILQNGTMTWLGQQVQSSTVGKPIPPIAVRSLHVNVTTNGINEEVPFQVEDWASDYRIPLGLTNNATVFSNRQMIVVLLTGNASEFTIWWDGRDQANQTSKAFTNIYFVNDNTANGLLTNGILSVTMQIVHDSIYDADVFKVTSVSGTSTSTATFMRINRENSTYGASASYVIHHGIVRDIVQQEAEWGGGAVNSPNVYASIVLTLPANVSYFTYSLRLMFINSSQTRILTDLCPILLSTSLSSLQVQTEDGTLAGLPIVQNSTGPYYNYTSGSWTAHHWSQLISNDGTRGTGIMFTDTANQNLYAFNSIAGGNTGALNAASNKLIELLPVRQGSASASFRYPLDITWTGAVATFSNTTPIYSNQSGTPKGLWALVEYPPTITQTARS